MTNEKAIRVVSYYSSMLQKKSKGSSSDIADMMICKNIASHGFFSEVSKHMTEVDITELLEALSILKEGKK